MSLHKQQLLCSLNEYKCFVNVCVYVHKIPISHSFFWEFAALFYRHPRNASMKFNENAALLTWLTGQAVSHQLIYSYEIYCGARARLTSNIFSGKKKLARERNTYKNGSIHSNLSDYCMKLNKKKTMLKHHNTHYTH